MVSSAGSLSLGKFSEGSRAVFVAVVSGRFARVGVLF